MGCGQSLLNESDPNVQTHAANKFRSLSESKIVVLGNSAVGKSSLALRFCQGRFPQSHEVTIGAAFLQQTVRTSTGVPHKLHIWDTGGQERFRAMAPLYYRDAAGAIVVFDCTDTESFASVSFWLEELASKGPPNIVILVVANKCDINPSDRVITSEEAGQFCRSHSLAYFETSALTGLGVGELFTTLTDRISLAKRV